MNIAAKIRENAETSLISEPQWIKAKLDEFHQLAAHVEQLEMENERLKAVLEHARPYVQAVYDIARHNHYHFKAHWTKKAMDNAKATVEKVNETLKR